MRSLKLTPTVEYIALICSVVMLVAFLILPWADVMVDRERKLGETGVGIASTDEDTAILRPVDSSDGSLESGQFTFTDEDGNTDTYEALLLGQRGYLTLFLVPLAGIGGIVLVLMGLAWPKSQRTGIWIRQLLAAGALIHYAIFAGAFRSVAMTGVGFWAALVGAVGLFFLAAGKEEQPEAEADVDVSAEAAGEAEIAEAAIAAVEAEADTAELSAEPVEDDEPPEEEAIDEPPEEAPEPPDDTPAP
ncbi:MAG: hypothetical protein JXJ20_02310 [Anaerolineae bacterium]|nr:hypothetical protein [Anaerolineae bacterium]